ncbi:MAG: hypothetical protein CM1200mP30_16560 [Pseudomonadota bacterium]|nr:MAG: hypothetical protein CM1200mP30_16560 [Pseudomonadota bacterium]
MDKKLPDARIWYSGKFDRRSLLKVLADIFLKVQKIPVEKKPGPEHSIGVLKNWLKECFELHIPKHQTKKRWLRCLGWGQV